MKNIESVNKIKHAKTRIITRQGEAFGDGVMLVNTFPAEFRFLQTQYPILFQRNEAADSFDAYALCGFEDGENLFLNQDGWNATYIPLMMRRQPFHIGFTPSSSESAGSELRVMHINMDSPRVNEEEGERLFTDAGENSDYLNYAAAMLETIHQWNEQSSDFYRELILCGLLESVTFDITLPKGVQSQLLGFYTVNEEQLRGLNADTLERLNKKGYLLAIYMVVASIDNIKKLIALKNKKEN